MAAHAGTVALVRSDLEACASLGQAESRLRGLGLGRDSTVVIAAGEINPNASIETLRRSNLTLPSLAAQAAVDLGARAVTLGTVLEARLPPGAQNPYVQSKFALAKAAEGKWLHLRLNTIYGGGAPASFMFLGQLLAALKAGERFSMTSGEQRREYHHVEDEATAILTLSARMATGMQEVNSGQDTSLAELARGVFTHFGRGDLLGIGDLPFPAQETYHPQIDPASVVTEVPFRDTVAAVCTWLEKYL